MSSRAVEKNRETSIRRRRLLTLLALTGVVAVLACAAPARAQTETIEVTVVEVSGWLDRIQTAFLGDALADADAAGAEAVVVRLDSPGVVADRDDVNDLVDAIARSRTPLAVWIGPGDDARARGDTRRILEAADVTGASPGADAGGAAPDVVAPTLGDFIVALDGRAGITIPTTVIDRDEGGDAPPQRRLDANVRVSFAEPPFVEQLLHAVSSPGAAYLLAVAGMLLVVFELFTGGVGVAAAIAIICLALGGYGLGALPTSPIGLALLVAGVLGFAIDVQVGVPRTWTVIGTLSFTAGSFFLYARSDVDVPLVAIVAVVAGVVLFMVAGMPAMVRTRFSTPTIGRESMIGELGTAATDVAPDGVVSIRTARWRARTNRATPIRAGEPVRVAAIDGLLLEVEPLEGAARDAGH